MSSLNEGFEFDEELTDQDQQQASTALVGGTTAVKTIDPQDLDEVIFEDVTPGEVPQLDEDTSLVTVVDASKDLDYLQQDIVRADGMNKTFAMEAERIMPGFLNDKRPLVFYTEFPSKTNFKAALEAIEEERKSILKRIWEAIVAFMKKASEWLDTLVTNLGKLRGKADKAAEVFDRASSFASELDGPQKGLDGSEAIIAKVKMVMKDKTSPAAETYLGSLEQGLDAYQRKFQSIYKRINRDDALYAIASKSSVVPMLLDIGKNASQIFDGYSDIDGRWLENLLLDKKSGDMDERNAEYAERRILSVAQKQRLASFKDYSKAAELSLKQRMSEYDQKNKPLKDLLKIFATTFKSRDMSDVEEAVKTATGKFKALQKTMLEFTTQPAWVAREVQSQDLTRVNRIFRLLHEELHAIVALFGLASKVYAGWVWMGNALDEAVRDYQRHVTAKSTELQPADKANVYKYFGMTPQPAAA